MIHNILVPVDGSAQADKAITLAADLAHRYEAKITIYHVATDVRRGTIPAGLRHYALSEHVPIDNVMAAVSQQILELAEERARAQGLNKVELITELGDPAGSIIAYAKLHDIDLIVMGSRGLSDLQGLFQGSISHKVAHLSPCTCVAVR